MAKSSCAWIAGELTLLRDSWPADFWLVSCLERPMHACSECKSILVVDDEPLVCETVRMLLQFDGHLVESAGNVRDALALFEPGKFDLVITDFFMPVTNGEQLALAIKSKDPVQPIVMLTAYPEKLQSRDHPLSCVDFFLAKPLEIADLRNAVSRVSAPAS